ncbi:MAG: hypothetical protein HY319_25730 [Armatimonadetes bacterium]|nr:hypothetical protein [Armatimonadota bacterium]
MKIRSASTLLRSRPASPPVAPAPSPILSESASSPQEVTRNERIGHFVQDLTGGTLKTLRYLSAMSMGTLIGTTVGMAALAPSAIRTGSMALLAVGSAAAGGLGSLAGYLVERHTSGRTEPDSRATDTAVAGLGALSALPKFAYPSVIGAEAAQKELIYQTLDRLPMSDVTATATMDVVPGLDRLGVSGLGLNSLSQGRIWLDPGYVSGDLVIHEVGHTLDMLRGRGLIESLFHRGGFGQPPYVSGYAGTNRFEDFAESHVYYHDQPDWLRSQFPGKYELMDQAHPRGVQEWLLDQPAVREAGRRTGDALATAPHLRTAAALGSALIGPWQLHRGARQLELGLERDDAWMKLEGKLHLASAALLLTYGVSPVALAVNLAHAGALAALKRDPETLEKANSWAERALAVSLGPIGMIGAAIRRELGEAGVPVGGYRPVEGSEPAGKTFASGILSMLGGSVAGSLIGAAVGTAIAGAGGSSVGSMIGQLSGAVVGTGAWALWTRSHSHRPPGPLDLTRSDKLFLGAVAGGAVTGGLGGAVLGHAAGGAIGGALGSLAGPVGAVSGALAGQTVGMLGGALALARVGAQVGRRLAPSD